MTIDLSNDIHSLTEFKRRTNDFVRRMKKTGHPLVLTVNGKAELVVQDARAYQALLDLLDHVEAIEGIRRGLEDVKSGHTRSLRQALDELHRRHEVSG